MVLSSLKLSYHSGSFYNYSLETLFKLLNENGYSAVELNAEKYYWEEGLPHLHPNISDEEVDRIKQNLNKFHLELSSVSAHIPLLHEEKEEREKSIDFTKNLIDIADDLGAAIVHGLSGRKNNINEDLAMDYMAESVNSIVEYADKKGIKYAIENIAGMFINSGERFKELKENIDAGELYLNLDTSNSYLVENNLLDFIASFKNDIIHIHIKDAIGNEQGFEFPPLGKGNINFGKLLKEIERINYNGYLSIEYVSHIFGYEDNIKKIPEESAKFIRNKESG